MSALSSAAGECNRKGSQADVSVFAERHISLVCFFIHFPRDSLSRSEAVQGLFHVCWLYLFFRKSLCAWHHYMSF